MVRTRVGYSGGTRKDPTYHSLGDHTETIQMEYDPTVVSYEKLLDVFWESHYPAERPYSRQYMAAIFHHNDEQKRKAEKSLQAVAERIKSKIYTTIVPANRFYSAEAYHQKYRLRQARDAMAVLKSIYPKDEELVESTVAARLNGYLYGYGNRADLESSLADSGLDPEQTARLLDAVKGRGRRL